MLRLAVVGIDGSGKSTTTLRAIQQISRSLFVVKPGRPNIVAVNGRIRNYLPAAGEFFEKLFARADRTKSRMLIGQTRILFIVYLAAMESWMVRRFSPQVVLSSRCPILDSAVYEEFYYPVTTRHLDLEQRLEMSRIVTRLPPRSGYFHLLTPVPLAMDRIYKRIQRLYSPSLVTRDYWLHLHENPPVLHRISQRIETALFIVRKRFGSGVLQIDTTHRDEFEVANIVSECTLKLPADFSEPLYLRV